jgi:hypothetical protein
MNLKQPNRQWAKLSRSQFGVLIFFKSPLRTNTYYNAMPAVVALWELNWIDLEKCRRCAEKNYTWKHLLPYFTFSQLIQFLKFLSKNQEVINVQILSDLDKIFSMILPICLLFNKCILKCFVLSRQALYHLSQSASPRLIFKYNLTIKFERTGRKRKAQYMQHSNNIYWVLPAFQPLFKCQKMDCLIN